MDSMVLYLTTLFQYQDHFSGLSFFSRLSEDTFMVFSQEVRKKIEVFLFIYGLFLMVPNEKPEYNWHVIIEQFSTYSLFQLIGQQLLGESGMEVAVCSTHEEEILVAVPFELPVEFELVRGTPDVQAALGAHLEATALRRLFHFGHGESGEEGVKCIVDCCTGTGEASEQVTVVLAVVTIKRHLASDLVQIQDALLPFLFQGINLWGDNSLDHLFQFGINVPLGTELPTDHLSLLGQGEPHKEGTAFLGVPPSVFVSFFEVGVLELEPGESEVQFHIGTLFQLVTGFDGLLEVHEVIDMAVGERQTRIFLFLHQQQIYTIYHMQRKAFANAVFQALLRELTLTSPINHFNSKRVIQSSVGMIFRATGGSLSKLALVKDERTHFEFERIQLLFTQRAGYQGDRNAWNVVFPGGQCDEGESDLQACKRELFQEIGLKVEEQCIYLGQLPSNFFYLGKRGKDVYITCHLWCMREAETGWRETLNPAQLCDSKWVPLGELLKGENYLVEKSLRMGILERMASKYKLRIIADVSKNVQSIITPELNLSMGRNLWGLTLWLWSYTLQMAVANMARRVGREQELEEARGWIRQIDNFLLKYPALAVIKSWHYFNRLKPFTYRPPSKYSRIVLVSFLFCLLAAVLVLIL